MEETGLEKEKCPRCGKTFSVEKRAPHLLSTGLLLHKRYLVGTVLGEGGFGITYIGRDTMLDMRVAIKEYFPQNAVNRNCEASADVFAASSGIGADFEAGKSKFLTEARTLAKFSGKAGVVDIRDFFEENNTAYIIMEFIDGVTLSQRISDMGRLNFGEVFTTLEPVMKALQDIHKEGLIHRDISPDNIMIAKDGKVKLLDFGTARIASDDNPRSLSVVLKPGYAPEEQYRSKGNQGPWTDVYALCATMYKCLTGITPEDSMQRVFSDELKEPSLLGADITPETEAVLLKGMSVFHKDRYSDIEMLLNALSNVGPAGPAEEPETASETNETKESAEKTVTHVKNAVGETEISGEEPEVRAPENPPVTAQSPVSIKTKIKSKKHKKRKVSARKKWIIIGAVLGAAAVIAILVNNNMHVTIAGEKYPVSNNIFSNTFNDNSNNNSVSLNNEKITTEDVSNLSKMDNDSSVSFYGCEFNDGAYEVLAGLTNINSIVFFNTVIPAPSLLSQMQSLEFLTISGKCGFSDISFLSSMPNIRYLNLGNTYSLDADITAKTDFSPISGCKSLEQLNIEGVGISDISFLSGLSNLETLELKENRVSDITSLKNLTKMRTIEMGNNQISNISSLAGLENLYDINFNNNKISDISALAGKKELVYLKLAGNQIQDISLLADCPALSIIDFTKNKITDISALKGNNNLGYLYMADNRVVSLTGLEDAKNLKEVHMDRNNIQDISALKLLTKLKIVDMDNNAIGDISALSNSVLLEQVSFENNRIKDISIIGKSYESLEYLNCNNNLISDISALSNCSALKGIELSKNKITDIGALSGLRELIAIDLSYNAIESCDALSECPSLKAIDLSHNRISDINGLSNLTAGGTDGALDLSSNNITDISPLPSVYTYHALMLYSNPIKDYAHLKDLAGSGLGVSDSNTNNSEIYALSKFKLYYFVDIPLDRQQKLVVGLNTLTSSPYEFLTTEEADKEIDDYLSGNYFKK